MVLLASKTYLLPNYLKTTNKHIKSNKNISKLEVTLEPDPTTGIANVKTSLTKNYKVYNLNGVVVGTESTFKKLPKGVYIVNGKKVVKK